MTTGTDSLHQNEIVSIATLKLGGTTVTATAAELNASTAGLLATAAEINRAADVSTRLVAAGGTLAVTTLAHDGKIIALDTAAGSVCTLPAASGSGSIFRFIVTVTATSNSHIIKVANASDTLSGHVFNNDVDLTPAAFYKAAGTDDTITMNRTTTGGIIGDWIEAIDMKANVWFVTGCLTTVAGSNVATPFSATV